MSVRFLFRASLSNASSPHRKQALELFFFTLSSCTLYFLEISRYFLPACDLTRDVPTSQPAALTWLTLCLLLEQSHKDATVPRTRGCRRPSRKRPTQQALKQTYSIASLMLHGHRGFLPHRGPTIFPSKTAGPRCPWGKLCLLISTTTRGGQPIWAAVTLVVLGTLH